MNNKNRNESSRITFVEDSNKTHNNKYDYSKSIYINGNTKLIITCPIHGEFEQEPSRHRKGHGCYKCSRLTQLETKRVKSSLKFLKESKKTHNNKYDYSKVVFKNMNTQVDIICPIHGTFSQNPYNHYKGTGCPKCSNLNSAKNLVSFYKHNKIGKDQGFIYCIKFRHIKTFETFSKIGITRTTINSRYRGYYNWDKVEILSLSFPNLLCAEIEEYIHSLKTLDKYIPLSDKFEGKTECYLNNINFYCLVGDYFKLTP